LGFFFFCGLTSSAGGAAAAASDMIAGCLGAESARVAELHTGQ
jgi:hypothetical protein